MSYFLRNYNTSSCVDSQFAESSTSIVNPIAELSAKHYNADDVLQIDNTSNNLSLLLKHCAKLPKKSYILRIPNVEKVAKGHCDATEKCNNKKKVSSGEQPQQLQQQQQSVEARKSAQQTFIDFRPLLQVVASPTTFGVTALARTIVLRYGSLLENVNESLESAESVGKYKPIICDLAVLKEQGATGGNQLITLGLKCIFSVLTELNKRDPELCSQALSSLLQLIQNMPVDGLTSETYKSVRHMYDMLKQLRLHGTLEVSSMATSCMIGIAVAFGIPEFLLGTAASLFCDETDCEKADNCSTAMITIPNNHYKLANFVQRIVMNGSIEDCNGGDWWSHPLTEHIPLLSFNVSVPKDISPENADDRRLIGAIASDGPYVYILCCYGLFKYGTGLAETIAGKLYSSNTTLKSSKGSWLAMCNGSLYLRRRQSSRIWVIDTDTLREIGEIMLHTSAVTGALMTDGYSFYQANIDDYWQLNITALDDNFTPIVDAKHSPKYRLTTHNFTAYGDSQPIPHELPRYLPKSLQAYASDLQIGKETAFLLARTGKVYYAGNAKKYGLQDTNNVWMELVLPDSIVSLSVTSDSDTVLLRSGSGQVWILGQEPQVLNQGSPVIGRCHRKDNISGKGKLRKLHLTSRRKCISMAVSSGCIAYVTDNGKAYVFGRHAMNCNPETGQIYGLDNVHLATISLGKTHAAAVTRHGHIYTWGLNNLNQCGRIEVSESPRVESSGSGINSSKVDNYVEPGNYCTPEEHLYIRDSASICIKCGECSVRGPRCYGESTVSDKSLRKGTLCACGSEGESCCLRCGLCRRCSERTALEDFSHTNSNRSKTLQRSILQPAKLILNDSVPNVKVSLVACGNYHTLVLGADRNVFAFGSNCHGQLGVGNTQRYVGPQKVDIPSDIQVVQIAAGANHSVLRTADGSVITFGAHRQGQLAREGKGRYWYAKPKAVPGFGKGCGTVATWIGAVGDVTMIHSQKRVFSSDIALNCQVVCNKSTLIIFPNEIGKDYVAIRKYYSGFYQHSLGTAGLYTSWCLEPTYNLMWSFNAAEMRVLSLSDSVMQLNTSKNIGFANKLKEISILRAPEFIIPKDTEAQLSTHQAALSVLSITYVITALEPAINEEIKLDDEKENITTIGDGDSVNGKRVFVVDRFDGYGGGWGYSVHSVEAIQFSASNEIKLIGVGLFGGRGEYVARLKLFRLNGDDANDQNLELIAESDEMLYQCAPHEKTQLMFAKRALIEADIWYIVCAQIRGPSSDCGAGGRSVATGEDGVQFRFRTTRFSNNGTDVSVGQIPELIYLSKSMEKSSASSALQESTEKKENFTHFVPNAIRLQSLSFVTPTAMQSLLDTLSWSIDRALEFNKEDSDHQQSYSKERAVIIGIISLRIFCNYISRLFSYLKNESRTSANEYTCLIRHFGSILSTLFREANEKDLSQDFTRWALMEEAVKSYVSCSEILLPNCSVITERLASLMSTANRDWSLVALFDSLCRKNEVLPYLLLLDQDKTPGFSQALLTQKNCSDSGAKNSFSRSQITDFQNVLRFLFELAFTDHAFNSRHSSARLKYAAQSLISSIARELVTPGKLVQDGQTIFQTPHRFLNQCPQPNWDMSNGVSDAISFRVDSNDFVLHGIGVYRTAKNRKHRYKCELMCNQGNSKKEQWNSITKVSGVIGEDDDDSSADNTSMIRFSQPTNLKQNVLYAIKFSLDGGKTYCGEAGLETVCMPNGSKLYFQTCSLSHNGTSVTRGQIPFLLYCYQKKDVGSWKTSDRVQLDKWFLLLVRLLSAKTSNLAVTENLRSLDAAFFSTISGYIMLFLELNPRFALDVFAVLDDLLPMISSANSEETMKQRSLFPKFEIDNYRVTVESPHPYSPSSVYSKAVSFNNTVRFMSIQFDESCRTFQSEDILWIYVRVNHDSFVPVSRFYGSHEWPKKVLFVPGNHLWFVLETNVGSEEAELKEIFGFRCTVSGYSSLQINKNLVIEQELAWISASACRFLVQLPSDQSVLTALSVSEEEVNHIVKRYGPLLRKGLNLSHTPSVNEILGRNLPPPAFGPEMKFIKQFIACSSNTAAGFLAKWLMVEPIVDIHSSRLWIPCQDLKIGSPTKVILTLRDQYGSTAYCPSLDVEFTVQNNVHTSTLPEKNGSSTKITSSLNSLSQQSIPDEPYRPVYINKARYVAITMMNAYSNFSFEELRMAYLRNSVLREKRKGVHSDDGSYSCEWTPKQSGTYRIECKIDGFQLAQSYVVEVTGNNQKVTNTDDSQIRGSNKHRIAYLSRERYAICPRSLLTKGIRIRTGPLLNAPQIGVIPRGSVISYLEEVENDDGIWYKLTDETAAIHCDPHDSQAWCLQYSSHLSKQFLCPLQDYADTLQDATASSTSIDSNLLSSKNLTVQKSMAEIGEQSVVMDTDEVYIISSDQTLPLYDSPSLDDISAERLDGNKIKEVNADGWLCNNDGVWIRIPISNHKYALVQDANGRNYIRKKASDNLSVENGNIKPPSNSHDLDSQPLFRSRIGKQYVALRPSVADCCRTVFAAFLWHEKLVHDAVACSAYLKFHPELYNTSKSDDRLEVIASTPLYPLTRFWHEIFKIVQNGIRHNCFIQKVPSMRGNDYLKQKSKPSVPVQVVCELCEEKQTMSLTSHMRMAHPGCDGDCGGYGYNSFGKYINGWTGRCGEGGRQNAAWYLLCVFCRSKYITQTPTGRRDERNRRKREYHLTSVEGGFAPEQIIKRNAMFLLELNSSAEESENLLNLSSGWTINLYPQTNPASPTLHSASVQTGNDCISLQVASSPEDMQHLQRRFSYASDPGPKQRAINGSFGGNDCFINLMHGQHLAKDDYHAKFLSGTSAVLLRRSKDETRQRPIVEVFHSPSIALKRLFYETHKKSTKTSRIETASFLSRLPELTFVIEHQDLTRIKEAMATSVARATFFAHSLRVWNWLLKSVSSESSVSDILVQYLTALSSYFPLSKCRLDDACQARSRILPHPWSVCFLAGPIAKNVVNELHSFLHTVFLLSQANNTSRVLRCLCFRIWTFQLTVHEKVLLPLICNMLATVTTVLSDPSVDQSLDSSDTKQTGKPDIKDLEDITMLLKIEASSRQAMVVCLTDGKSDTFWESAEEGKSGSTLKLHWNRRLLVAAFLAVYVDNVKDEGFALSSVVVSTINQDATIVQIHDERIENAYIGWVKCCIANTDNVQIAFEGSGPSVRIRQIKVLGWHSETGLSAQLSQVKRSPIKPSPSHQLLFNPDQADAFALFQAISAQAFSDEFSYEENGPLRQQVLELLLSRDQLPPLQSFVCSEMAVALEREVTNLQEKRKTNYSYACGLTLMLVRICSSKQGVQLFEAHDNLLITLSELLIFAPSVVQYQVIEAIEKLIALFTPAKVDLSTFVCHLLIVVAKVITLQIRDKKAHSLKTATVMTGHVDFGTTWRLDRISSVEMAKIIIKLLREISEGVINEQWKEAMKTELSERVMELSRMDLNRLFGWDRSKLSSCGLKLPLSKSSSYTLSAFSKSDKFWLSIAALTIITDSEWLELSPTWQKQQLNKDKKTELLCENHDDGHTLAEVFCIVCEMALCRECFTILHLNKRNRSHDLRVLQNPSGIPKLDVHEGCTRFRLSNLLILLHPSTLNGMIEFDNCTSNEPYQAISVLRVSGKTSFMSYMKSSSGFGNCRFCGNQLTLESQAEDEVCDHADCLAAKANACNKKLFCGHFCGGIANEKVCLPCMTCKDPRAKQDADDLCVICFTDRLGGAPCIQLKCGHTFHFHCVKSVLEKRWSGPRIYFRFMQCPLCKQQIEHPALSELLDPLKALQSEVVKKALLRLEYDGLLNSPAVTSRDSIYNQNPEAYAMDRYVYVLCYKCGKAYFGGESRCQQALDTSQYNEAELLCGACSDVNGAQVCGRHGIEYLEYKCRFCCSVAVYFCFGTTHFCAVCHDDFQRLMRLPKNLLPKCPAGPKGMQLEGACPLRISHPPTGEEFALGCGVCRNLSTF